MTAKNKKKLDKIIFVTIVVIFLMLFVGKPIWGIVGVHIPYAEGERSAMIIKISNKGLIWKTWEGEAVLSQNGFAVTYIWKFSIDNNDPNREALLEKLTTAFETGQTVKVKYEQMAGSVPWRGKTDYFIKEIE